MQYWVIKADPKKYSYDQKLRIGREENWYSQNPPVSMQVGDRLFLWESTPRCRVVGFAVVTKPVSDRGKDGKKWFRALYLTNRLEWMPGIAQLKTNPRLRDSVFLKPAVMKTVYEMSAKEAEELYSYTIARNPSEDVWRDVSKTAPLPDIEVFSMEGSPKLVTHLRRERNPQLARTKKDQFRVRHGRLFCEACKEEWRSYRKLNSDIFEVHHTLPLSSSTNPVKTRLADLAVLCPNCHRAIHRTDPMLSVEALAKRLGRKPLK